MQCLPIKPKPTGARPAAARLPSASHCPQPKSQTAERQWSTIAALFFRAAAQSAASSRRSKCPGNCSQALVSSRLDSCTLANAIETFRVRLRNEGFAHGSVHCLFPQLQAMVGYAATIMIRGAAPAFAGPAYHDRTDLWEYIQSVPAPRVVVVQDTASLTGLGSLVGEVHMNILQTLGCVGAVTNGAVRDLPAAAAAGFHLFAGNVTVSHAYVHIVEFGGPVEVGGLSVRSGDLMHGDLHGVQSIPLDLAGRIPRRGRQHCRQTPGDY